MSEEIMNRLKDYSKKQFEKTYILEKLVAHYRELWSMSDKELKRKQNELEDPVYITLSNLGLLSLTKGANLGEYINDLQLKLLNRTMKKKEYNYLLKTPFNELYEKIVNKHLPKQKSKK